MTPLSSREFPETSRLLLERASESGDEATAALNEFTSCYYTAVGVYIRALVRDDHRAEEFTHAFFDQKVLRTKGVLTKARKDRKFRPFLKQTIRHFVIDQYRSDARRRQDPADGLLANLRDGRAKLADEALLRTWGRSVVALALERTRQIATAKQQHDHFTMFERRFLGDPDRRAGFREIGHPFGLDEKAARGRVSVIVDHFRDQLRELLKSDAGAGDNIDEEVRNLIALL